MYMNDRKQITKKRKRGDAVGVESKKRARFLRSTPPPPESLLRRAVHEERWVKVLQPTGRRATRNSFRFSVCGPPGGATSSIALSSNAPRHRTAGAADVRMCRPFS